MPTQYVVCNVIGTGTRTDRCRPQTAGLANAAALIPNGPDGRPLRTFCLAQLGAANLAAALALAGVEAFPAVPLATLISSLTNAQRNNVQARLTARGYAADIVATSATLGDLIRRVGQGIDPAFSGTGLAARG